MQTDKTESSRLRETAQAVASLFPRFGPNKTREIIRLVYEISKIKGSSPAHVIRYLRRRTYGDIKRALLKERYPLSWSSGTVPNPHLPKVEFLPEDAAGLENGSFYPRKVFFERAAEGTVLHRNFRKAFPRAQFIEIASLKEYLGLKPFAGAKDYNERKNYVFLVDQAYTYFKRCPCTKGAVGCGYHIFNLGFGCIFDCTYCFLQEYTNRPGIVLPVNLDDYFRNFNLDRLRSRRIGTGEFSDSLMLDGVTQYSAPIVDFFRNQKNVAFEFKTKSANIGNLIKARHSGNIVVSWSLNPQIAIDQNEFFSASLETRLFSAARCARAGYKVGFHFDPLLHFEGWEREYARVVEKIFSLIDPGCIAWISLGTLRFNRDAKPIIERRFPGNKILDGELLPGFDGKLRYPPALRVKMYEAVAREIHERSRKVPVYLCMEEKSIWKVLKKWLKVPVTPPHIPASEASYTRP